MNLALALRLRRHGILVPRSAIHWATEAKLPLADACAMLVMETAGGRNIYGHDPVRNPIKSPPGGNLGVTKLNYALYRHYRNEGLGMQGVGVAQLTWYSFQDQADRYGGCWLVGPQLRVALEHLAALTRRYGEWGGFRAYNGTGAAATHYANTATAYARHFRAVIAGRALLPTRRSLLRTLAAAELPESHGYRRQQDLDFLPLDFFGEPLPPKSPGH